MRPATLLRLAFALLLAAALPANGQLDARAVPTYESVGLYWSNPLGATAATGCNVRFRRVGEASYREGLPLWYDARTSECRGSLVHLQPGTAYEAELSVPGQLVPNVRTLLFATWAHQVPVARTVSVASSTATASAPQLTINSGGTPVGYVVYQGAAGVLDGDGVAQYNILVNASYVVIRGLTLRGAREHAIRLSAGVTDVIIEDNDISGWGRTRGGNLGVNADSAVYAFCGNVASPALTRVTIQRNVIHEPRYGSNSWSDGHPEGPQAITIERCPGNHVIRHNEFYSVAGKYFNDIVGGSDNVSTTGFPNGDSDIYGNKLSHSWDDAIEVEGGNRNVRVWGNYMDRTGTGIASTITSIGPLYLFRNVYNRGRMLERAPLDSDDRQAMFKAGSNVNFPNGRRYIFHNTMLQAAGEGAVHGLGGSAGVSGTGPQQLIHETVTRNNIWHLWRAWEAFYDEGTDNDFARDMYNGNPGAPIADGIRAVPRYAPGNGWESEAGGRYQLAVATPGYDQGLRLPNFNDDFLGAGPDIGAHEGGTGPMVFGIAASPGPAVNGAGPAPPPPPPPPVLSLGVTPASLDFGAQSMGTRSPAMPVTVRNDGTAPVSVSGVAVSGPFTQSNDCGTLAVGQTCRVDVVFAPPVEAGALLARRPQDGALTVTSADPGSPRAVRLEGVGEKSLVTHYYRSILGRAPDAGGKSFWDGEAARLQSLAADVNEAWFAMAMAFFSSAEYRALGRDNAGFVADLYNTFFNRPPDAGGLGYWRSQLDQGLPREVALAGFMFSPEFNAFTRSIFGDTAARAEVNMVMDFYRGLLGRLPESDGLQYWVQRFRAAQCSGPGAVYGEVEAITSMFFNGGEYGTRGRTNAQFVGDLYNAFLRRGGDLDGVRFWLSQVDSGARSRDQVRQDFRDTPEFNARVQAVVAQGC
ncbi:MAG TPA: DUF4214 domain-containing protein [Usitatibacter sp.]|nr:DUF4214 domain-containing protein [Usitatibacter sp.]